MQKNKNVQTKETRTSQLICKIKTKTFHYSIIMSDINDILDYTDFEEINQNNYQKIKNKAIKVSDKLA